MPTGVITTQPSTLILPSGAQLGAGTIAHPSQLPPITPIYTPAVTPWQPDPTGLGTAQLIRAEVLRHIAPLKDEIKSLRSEVQQLKERNKKLEERDKELELRERDRVAKEKERRDAEKRRIHAEKKRIDDEAIRIREEQGRVAAEKTRVDSEKRRVALDSSHGGPSSQGGTSLNVSGTSQRDQQTIKDLETAITKIKDDVKELQDENTRLKNDIIQLRNNIAQAPAPPQIDNPVRDWKRRACEEVLELTAPPGRAPLVKAKANHRYHCHDLTCTFQNRTNCLDTYIKHLQDKHNFNIRETTHTVAQRDTYLPRQ